MQRYVVHVLSLLLSASCGPAPAPPAATPRKVPPPASVTAPRQPVGAPAAPRPAAPELDCAHTPLCRVNGYCHAYQGRCTKRTVAQCEADKMCHLAGACAPWGAMCAPSKDEHCQASVACRERGRCRLGPHGCETSEEACLASDICRTEGLCHVHPGDWASCWAKGDDDCKASTACKDGGRCLEVQHVCTQGCQTLPACKSSGLCERGPGHTCIATAAGCRASVACRISGQCSVKGGFCHVLADADCRRSEQCSKHKRCVAIHGQCFGRHGLECACPPSGPAPDEEWKRRHAACVERGGGWLPGVCGQPPM